MIEKAKSGRAKCRTCREKIAKDELRYGQLDLAFGDDGSFRWHHLRCAAKKLPDGLKESLDAFEGEMPDRESLEEAIKVGRKGNAYPRGELASSGRAACRGCQTKIAKGEVRVAVEREVEGVAGKRPGYMHPECTPKYFKENETVSVPVEEILANSDLPVGSLEALGKTLRTAVQLS
jgi:poly [ADP-ribose] polymerase 1